MTNQEFFDKTVEHLVRQGQRAVGEDGHCRYRTPEGLKCAAGVHIPDDVYRPAMEGTSIGSLIDHVEDFRDQLRPLFPSRELAQSLQVTHDKPSNWDNDGFRGWTELAEVASNYELNFNVDAWKEVQRAFRTANS